MIVQCPECQSQYRVKDGKVPDSGGKISCPQCGHSFVVYPDESSKRAEGDRSPKPYSASASSNSEPRYDRESSGAHAQASGGSPNETPGADAEDAATTEVMSSDEMPDFMQHDAVEDAFDQAMSGGEPDMQEAETELVDDDIVGQAFGSQSESSAEADGVDINSNAADGSDSHRERESSPPASDRSFDALPTSEPTPSGQSGPSLDAYAPEDEAERERSPSESVSLEAPAPSSDAQTSEEGAAVPSRQEDDSADLTRDDRTGPDARDGGSGLDDTSEARLSVDDSPGDSSAVDHVGDFDPDYDGPWKLQTDVGLTYEFPDTEALEAWLEDRGDRDEYQVSPDGSTFYDFDELPQFVGEDGASDPTADSSSAARQPASPGRPDSDASASPPPEQPASPGHPDRSSSTSAPDPSSPSTSGSFDPGDMDGLPDDDPEEFAQSIADSDASSSKEASPSDDTDAQPSQNPANGYELPEKERDEGLDDRFLYGAFFTLMFIAMGVGLQVSDTYDFSGFLPSVAGTSQASSTARAPDRAADDSTPTGSEQSPSGSATPSDEKTGGDSSKKNDEVEVDRVLEAARRSMRANRLKTAADKLDVAKLIDPKRPETYDLLGKVHDKMGNDDKAETHRERAQTLRQQGPSDGTQPPGSSNDRKPGTVPPGVADETAPDAGSDDSSSSSNAEASAQSQGNG